MTRHKRIPAGRRPWLAALIVVLLVTGLSLVVQSDLPFVGAGATGGVAGSADDPTDGDPTEIVSSTRFVPVQEVVQAPPAFRRAPEVRRAKETCVQQSDVTLNVLTFNIHSGLGPNNGLGLEQIAREIESWDPDVVLMQEIDRFRHHSGGIDQPAWFADRLGMEYSYGPNESPGNGQIGNATLSRFPIVDQTNTHLPHQPGLKDALLRGVLRTRIEVGETVVSIFNTHLQPSYDSLKLSQMRVVAQQVAADPQPKILGGDFNATSAGAVLALARPFLSDTWESVGVGPDGTSPNGHKGRIDFVLHSSEFVPQAARTIDSAVSDHRAVGATLTLPGDGEVCVPVLGKGLRQRRS
ncbi:MAG: endonuclease/exonuclease/phosphatase family protein [Nocardioides sp.]